MPKKVAQKTNWKNSTVPKENGFDLAQRRSVRGEKTSRSILQAAFDIIDEQGLSAASQDAIAKRAGISQSTLRHHYPTRDMLHAAIFTAQSNRNRQAMEKIVMSPSVSAQERLIQIVETHLDYIIGTSDAVAFEHYAYTTRNPEVRIIRDEWHRWLLKHYSALIQQMNPDIGVEESDSRAFQIITLCLGCWLTLGRTRPQLLEQTVEQLKANIISLVRNLGSE